MTKKHLFTPTRRLASGLVAMLTVASAHAVTNTWTGSVGSTDWATTANWSAGTITTGDALVFTSANASASNTLTNTLATTFNAASVTFNSGALGYTMTGNAFNLTGAIVNNASGVTETFNNDVVLANTGGTSTWTLNSGTTTTFAGSMTSGTIRTVWWGASATATGGTINLNGATNLTFGGANFSALIVRGNGTVLNVGSTGSLTVSSASQANSGFFNIGNEASAGNVTVNIANGGSITVNGTGSATIPTSSIGGHAGDIADVNISGTMTYGSGTNLAIGSTSGTTTVDINNGGILNLNNSARSVAIAASGTVTINSGGTMTSARTWGASTGNLVLAGGTFQATAAQTLASGLLISTTSANSTIDTNGNAVSISSGISGAGGLIKAGTNTLTLSGANTYTGNTTINAGGLTLASTGSMLFRITDISNSEILGTGTGAFDGTFKLDLSGVTASNTWTLVDVGSLTGLSYGGTFSVADNAGSITFNNSGGTWTGIASGVGTYTFTQSTGQLTFTAVPEPHEFALAIVALLGVMVFIRRRNQQV